ncbi:MAG: OsmC family protein [Deltaproteobacteria bacterium]|nr:OsmC family protein [Deltaproteobacteria bacterium]
MDITVDLLDGKKVVAHVGPHAVLTDQPVDAGGTDEAPAPFMLFLASLATCAGFYVQGFCRTRNIPTDGIRITQTHTWDARHRLADVALHVEVPPSFPERYLGTLKQVVDQCAVKRVLADPPAIHVVTTSAAPAAA